MRSNRKAAEIGLLTEQLVRDFRYGVKPLDPFDDGWYSGWMRNLTECPHNDEHKRSRWIDGKILGREERAKHDSEGIPYGKVVDVRKVVEVAGCQRVE